jgi:hypothetical protein
MDIDMERIQEIMNSQAARNGHLRRQVTGKLLADTGRTAGELSEAEIVAALQNTALPHLSIAAALTMRGGRPAMDALSLLAETINHLITFDQAQLLLWLILLCLVAVLPAKSGNEGR